MKKANLRLRNKLFYVLVMFVLGTLVYIFSSYKCNEYEKEYAEKFSQLAIEKQDYPKRFTLNHNLQNLIENIVVLNNEFNEATVCDEELQKYFIDRYLKNTYISCDYILENYEKTGELTRQQVEYIQWSMTGKYVSFENIACDLVNIRETSSGWSYGELKNYSYELKDETVNINGIVTTKTVGYLGEQVYEFDASLEENPYSCFDGYSIKSISIKDVTPVIKPDYKVHEVVGSLIEENITDGKVLIEVYDSKDNLSYDHCITLNMLSNEELQKLVLENKDKELVIRYVLDKEQGACITEITPIDIELKSEDKKNTETIPSNDWQSSYIDILQTVEEPQYGDEILINYNYGLVYLDDKVPFLIQRDGSTMHIWKYDSGKVYESNKDWSYNVGGLADYWIMQKEGLLVGEGGAGPTYSKTIIWKYDRTIHDFQIVHYYEDKVYEDLNKNGKFDDGEDKNDGGAQDCNDCFDMDKAITYEEYIKAIEYIRDDEVEIRKYISYSKKDMLVHLEQLSR